MQPDYLSSLRRERTRRQHHRSRSSKAEPRIDSVTLIGDNTPRATCKSASIKKLHVGPHELVRSAIVSTADGTELHRPLQLLYPLECDAECQPTASTPALAIHQDSTPAVPPSNLETPAKRPPRTTAVRQCHPGPGVSRMAPPFANLSCIILLLYYIESFMSL